MKRFILPGFLALMSLVSPNPQAASIQVSVDQPRHRVPATLWGIFFEDINLSADGGIYPELVRNRSFEDADQPEHWTVVEPRDGTSLMSIDTERPLNPLNRKSLRLNLDGQVGVVNRGYWGMNAVKGESYTGSLAARTSEGFQGQLAVVLETADGRELARRPIEGLSPGWKSFQVELIASDSDPKAQLRLVAKGKGTLWLDMVSLLPARTWKQHGLRADLSEMLDALRPAFVRFPGGCWVEGDDMAHMYQWKKTIGDVAHRQPLGNIWGYQATHGLGFHEYLQMSEDLRAAPLFCINVGMSHREVVPLDQMGSWVQDALDAIQYANGPVDTVWGSLRAQHGHAAPFGLKYLEIGNENGGPAYHERWELFYRAIKAKHPEIQLIANVWDGYPTNSMPDVIDEHYYNSPEFFMQQADRYDTYARTGPKVFVGEYAVTQGCGQGNLHAAIGEAAFMTGMERNSDVVIMASYAPLFVNVNHKRWNPDLINFDSARAYGLPSYYVQKLFSEHHGDVVLPTRVEAPAIKPTEKGGMIGVGTWRTKAEFKDLKVTRGNETLYASDFKQGKDGWKMLSGDWQVEDGVLRQTSMAENVRAIIGEKSWGEYTYTLKARKLSGDEGFLILFGVQDENAKSWWNIGGWGNDHHAIEMGGVVGNEVRGRIENGRWYDIRIEVTGANVKCYLDGKLLHDVKYPTLRCLYASATREEQTGDLILKVVNASETEQSTALELSGAKNLTGRAKVITLTSASRNDENSMDNPTRVAPVTSDFEGVAASFNYTFKPMSFTVFRCQSR